MGLYTLEAEKEVKRTRARERKGVIDPKPKKPTPLQQAEERIAELEKQNEGLMQRNFDLREDQQNKEQLRANLCAENTRLKSIVSALLEFATDPAAASLVEKATRLIK